MIIINDKLCIGCSLCIKICPKNAITGSKKKIHKIISKKCIECILCIPSCPIKCIKKININKKKLKKYSINKSKKKHIKISKKKIIDLIKHATQKVNTHKNKIFKKKYYTENKHLYKYKKH